MNRNKKDRKTEKKAPKVIRKGEKRRMAFQVVLRIARYISAGMLAITLWAEFVLAVCPGFIAYMAGYVLTEEADYTIVLGLWLLPSAIGCLVMSVFLGYITVRLWRFSRRAEKFMLGKYDKRNPIIEIKSEE